MHASSTNFITFNPGPSQLSPETIQSMLEIAKSGFLSQSHRSQAFMEVSQKAIDGLLTKLQIPSAYQIFYQPSSTAAMDTILRNLVIRKSFHFVYGSFSNLFFKTALEIGLDSISYNSPLNQAVTWEKAVIQKDIELIAVTHNETSTGLMWPQEELANLREKYPSQLLAVDVTSSCGGMKMDCNCADIWFGSVQKCLGLPSGLGFIIVSPRAFEKAKQVKGIAAWQRFSVLAEKMRNYQTPETPNMFDIALLAKQMSNWNIEEIEANTFRKAKLLYEENTLPWKPYMIDERWRSKTVIGFTVDQPEKWCQFAKEHNIILGKGYGSLKDICIRIANFPAITISHIENLLRVLKQLHSS